MGALAALVYGSIAGAATFGGILAVAWRRDLAVRYSHYANSFAAGALITIALAHLLPEFEQDQFLAYVFVRAVDYVKGLQPPHDASPLVSERGGLDADRKRPVEPVQDVDLLVERFLSRGHGLLDGTG